MNIEQFLISEEATLVEAMEALNENGQGIIFTYDGNCIKGVFSDGDFRRYVLKNGKMDCCVKEVANPNPYILDITECRDTIQFMKEKEITAVPIIDKKGRIVRIDFDNGVTVFQKVEINLPVVIMAGGKGSRLYPYTNVLPKPLIPIGEKTITERIIDQFKCAGCQQFYMIVNYKKNLIKAFFQENKDDIIFIEETEFLGSGGGLSLLSGKLESTFFVTNCDILIEGNYSMMLEHHKEKHNLVTMVCAKKDINISYGTVEIDKYGNIERLNEKPQLSFLTNTGLYILEPEFLDMVPKNTFIHITDIIQKCIDKGERVGTYIIDEDSWMDMGQIDAMSNMKLKLNIKEKI